MSELIDTDSNNVVKNATNEMLQLQSKISYKIAIIETRLTAIEGSLESILKVLSNGTRNITENTQTDEIMPVIDSDNEFQLIDSINELNDFEIKLKNPEFRKKSVSIRHPMVIYFYLKLNFFL